MDKLVPQMMGVSAAVLENVIFCHQSESDWPLSDSKALKLKFDDIFAATRYTKALEVLAKVKKEKAQNVKVMEAELGTVETAREQARKLKEELENTKRGIEGSIEKRGKIDAEVVKLEEEMKRYQGEADRVKAVEASKKETELRIELMKEEMQRVWTKMTSEISDSDESLMRSRAEQEQKREQLTAAIAEQERKTKSLAVSVEVNDREYQESVRLIGKHEQQQKEREQRQGDIAALRQRMTQQYYVDGSKMDDDAEMADEDGKSDNIDHRFARVMTRVLDKKKQDLQQHKETIQKVDSLYEDSIAQLRTREVKTSEAFSHKRTTAGKAVARIKELVGRNKEIESAIADDEYQQVQAELSELEQRIGTDGSGHENAEDETVRMSMVEKQRLLSSLQADVLVLVEERKKYAHQSELITLIKHKHSQLSSLLVKHNQALAALIAANDDDDIKLPTVQPMPASTSSFTALYGKEYDSGQLQSLVNEVHERVKSEWRAKERELSIHINEQSRLAGQQKMLADELTTLNNHVDRIRSQFMAVGEEQHMSLSSYKEERQWDEEMGALQAKLVKLTADGQKALVLVELYQKYMAKTAEDHKCQLCQKPFSSEEEEQFNERVESLVRQVSSEESRERNEKKIATCKKRLKVMHDLTPLVHDYLRLHGSERQQLAARIEAVKRDEDEYERQSEEMRRHVKTLSKREQRLAELQPLAANLARLYTDVMDTVKNIEKEREVMKVSSGGAAGGRGLEGITRELEEKEKLRGRTQAELTGLQERVQQGMRAREERTRRYHSLKSKVSEMGRLVDEKDKNQADVGKLKAEWEEAKEEADKLSAQHSSLKEQIVRQEKEREERRKRNADGESTLMAAVTTLQRDVDTYQQLLDALAHITTELDSAQAAGSTKQKLLDRASHLKKLRDERDNALHTLTALKEQLQSCISDLADLDANLEYRQRRADIEQQQRTLEQLKQQHDTLTSNSSFLAQLSQSEQRLAQLRSRRSELKGVMSQLEKIASDRLADLASPLYKDVQQRWSSKLIELKTSEMAVTDLETLSRCLDVSLMHYHTVKMREINDMLRDYWKAIYRGHDIDDIHIRSQVETDAGKRRTYSYSVMMRQGDIELEMRGRCSAGQRVLACLLIRLALADVFCIQAGMLALDEPTTNLDEGNIGAFAQALAEIIDKRRRQSNFQLIIITHDEHFVEEVGKRAQADYYYRVSKDAHNYSRIRRVAWQDDKEQ